MNKLNNKKGISLIVLVITIIVMIILAAAIILSLQSSGIIGKANEAQSETNISNKKEAATLLAAEYQLAISLGDSSVAGKDLKTYIKEGLEKQGIDTSDVTVTEEGEIIVGAGIIGTSGINKIYRDKNRDKAIIPEGFSVSKVLSEQTIEDGLVIVDEDGNEFVWVPVDDMNMFKRTTTYTGTITELPVSSYKEPYVVSEDPTGEVAEYNAMYASVQENKGFYIARYEAGKEGTSTVVSKKGASVWHLPWGTSWKEVGSEGAVYRARQMYKDSKSVVSTLCYGVQWDSALQFIATKDAAYPNDISGEKGNYSREELTGSNDDYSVNNIYDMAGNATEWTMELEWEAGRCFRGGTTLDVNDYWGGSASARIEGRPEYTYSSGGFRVTLYIK